MAISSKQMYGKPIFAVKNSITVAILKDTTVDIYNFSAYFPNQFSKTFSVRINSVQDTIFIPHAILIIPPLVLVFCNGWLASSLPVIATDGIFGTIRSQIATSSGMTKTINALLCFRSNQIINCWKRTTLMKANL